MIYHFKSQELPEGYDVDIDDRLLKDFQEEMGNISQEVIETCMKIALVKYDDIGNLDNLKRRIEDVMFVEMVKHKDQRTKVDVMPNHPYEILGYNISIDEHALLLFYQTQYRHLSLNRLKGYVYIATKRHINEQNISDTQMSQYAMDELVWEMSRYE